MRGHGPSKTGVNALAARASIGKKQSRFKKLDCRTDLPVALQIRNPHPDARRGRSNLGFETRGRLRSALAASRIAPRP
jgi:hypothetical protein